MKKKIVPRYYSIRGIRQGTLFTFAGEGHNISGKMVWACKNSSSIKQLLLAVFVHCISMSEVSDEVHVAAVAVGDVIVTLLARTEVLFDRCFGGARVRLLPLSVHGNIDGLTPKI